ncbi:MAG TPA: tetratricopeptide repeat protein [Candidatus Limnocylindrales bacterium]|nr:tetratricopeptide repeat protein [Candidatus Limnocylindrales bacterium]
MHATADGDPSTPIDPAAPAFPATIPRHSGGALVGRDGDVARVLVALSRTDARIVTLAGPGGAGKSRLAGEAARRMSPELGGRVAWIHLASIGSDGQVPAELASGIGLADVPNDRLPAELRETLGSAPALLVFDDAEHVVDGVRSVAELVAPIDGVRVLVTTTTPLARPDEVVIAVDPLDLPADDADGAELTESPSVRLLLDRAAAAGADISVTPANAAILARIVRRVDGLPLAIELAGAMLRLLAPHQLLDRLDARLELEAPGPRLGREPASEPGADKRRSLRATMDWSHDLLSPEVQCLYRRLGVFSGTFGIPQLRSYLERSVEHGLTAPAIDVDDGVAALVSASLLRVVPAADDGEARYELLGLVRDDAARRLADSGEATAANWAHANGLLSLAEERYAEIAKQPRPEDLADLDAVHDDLLAVLDRARVGGNAPFVVRLAGALAEYWRVRGLLTEGRLWLDAALRMRPPEETAFRARALHGAGVLASLQGDFDRAKVRLDEAFRLRVRLGMRGEAAGTLNQIGLIALERGELDEAERVCREALEMRREAGDEAAVAGSLNSLGGVLQFSGNHGEARALFEESLAIRRGLGDEAGASVVLGNLGLAARDAGELEDGLRMLEEAIETRERLGDRQRLAVVRHNHALVLFDAGDLPAALAELEWSAATARELGDRLELSNALSDLGFVTAASGDLGGAATLQREALTIAARIRARTIVAQSIDGVAEIVARRGDPLGAARLWAAAETIRQTTRAALLAADRRRIDRSIAAAREAADADAWWSAWAAGEALSLEDAVRSALAATGQGDDVEAASATV